MKFSYTALTGENKKITGVLDTENLESAQAELHKMGVAIIDVGAISEDEYEKMKKEQEEASVAKGIQTFSFAALDQTGKDIEGTIDATDDYSAFKRLKSEYKFNVKELYISSASPEEKETAKGILEGYQSRYESDEKISHKNEKSIEENDDEISHELVGEIDSLIVNTKALIETRSELFSNELIREINGTLNELELIRTSNNIKHITEVSNTLYELISNPDKITGEIQDEGFKSILSKFEESALVKKEFDLYRKAIDASGAKNIFKSIAEKLKAMAAPKEADAKKPPSFFLKTKGKLYKYFSEISEAKQVQKIEKPKTKLRIVVDVFQSYMKASSPVLKKARKKELIKAIKGLLGKTNQEKKPGQTTEPGNPSADIEKKLVFNKPQIGIAEKNEENIIEEQDKNTTKKHKEFTKIFMEIDSFIGWLLVFYIAFFYLVDFSVEKNIGIKGDFVFRTLKTPLILDITIFLLIMHTILKIKNSFFRKNILAAIFLTFFGFGLFALIIINF